MWSRPKRTYVCTVTAMPPSAACSGRRSWAVSAFPSSPMCSSPSSPLHLTQLSRQDKSDQERRGNLIDWMAVERKTVFLQRTCMYVCFVFVLYVWTLWPLFPIVLAIIESDFTRLTRQERQIKATAVLSAIVEFFLRRVFPSQWAQVRKLW